MDTKEPEENPLKKIPQSFEDFITFNYGVSMECIASSRRAQKQHLDYKIAIPRLSGMAEAPRSTGLEDIVHEPELLTDCKYLRACIDETLRLAPAGPSELSREVLPGGTNIEGEHYPAGIIVGTPNWAMGRNEEQYGDAFTFRQERWIVSNELDSLNPEENMRRLKHGLHTFLKGPGDCVGQKLAMLQMSLIFARTLWQMDARLATSTDVGAGNAKLG